MSEEDKDSKSEAPTEKRIQETLDKGKVPFSRETTAFFSTSAIVLVFALYLPDYIKQSAAVLGDVLGNRQAWPLDTPSGALNLFIVLGKTIFIGLLGTLAPIFILGLASALGQNRPQFILNRIKPEFSKISLMKGLKRLFGKQSLIEFLRALFKFAAAGIVATMVGFWQYEYVLSHTMRQTQAIPASILDIAILVVSSLLFLLGILAVADLFHVRHEWMENMKMSKQEVKDEHKQSEGDPMIKQKTLSIARDRARQRMINDVSEASVVITNPTHFAVALRYRPKEDRIPKVMAKGQDKIALKIRARAEENEIPIVEDKPLARSLYKSVKVGAQLPPEFYLPVARIIRMILDEDKKRA